MALSLYSILAAYITWYRGLYTRMRGRSIERGEREREREKSRKRRRGRDRELLRQGDNSSLPPPLPSQEEKDIGRESKACPLFFWGGGGLVGGWVEEEKMGSFLFAKKTPF